MRHASHSDHDVPGNPDEQKGALIAELADAFVRTCNGVRAVNCDCRRVAEVPLGRRGKVVWAPPPMLSNNFLVYYSLLPTLPRTQKFTGERDLTFQLLTDANPCLFSWFFTERSRDAKPRAFLWPGAEEMVKN